MRIAFTGKGGSGKSTLASLFALWARQKANHVTAIDADLNQHMGYLLKFSDEAVSRCVPLSEKAAAIKTLLRGDNAKIMSVDHMAKTTPPGSGSRFLTPADIVRFFPECVALKDTVSLVRTGAFDDSDLAVNCYHSKTGIVEILLNHMIDGEQDVVVADMTAGIDAFASPLISRFDAVCLVVEPHPLSLKVYEQFLGYQKSLDFNLLVVVNKIRNESELKIVTSRLQSPFIVMPYLEGLTEWLFASDDTLKSLPAIDTPMETLWAALCACKRDWPHYWRLTIDLHRKNALSWANQAYKTDLMQQVDIEFLRDFSPEKLTA
jgi:CO dehydrogenase maturation factor